MTGDRQLILRADASHRTGVGHVMRTLAIGQAWQDVAGSVTLVSADLPDELRRRLDDEQIQVRSAAAPAGTAEDAAMLKAVATELRAAAIVVDGYHFDPKYHDVITGGESVTLAVDDYGHLDSYRTDFVLNQNPGITEALYPDIGARTSLLLGPRYALIRRDLRTHNDGSSPNEERDWSNILVTLGGSDPANATETVVRGLLQSRLGSLRVRVILGGLFEDSGRLEELVSGDDRFELLRSVRDMAAQYSWAGLAIAAGGSSNWEMCCFGLPRLVIVIADNQREIGRELWEAGIAVRLYDTASLTAEQLSEDVERAVADRESLRRAARKSLRLVDGQGASRCVSRLLSVTESV